MRILGENDKNFIVEMDKDTFHLAISGKRYDSTRVHPGYEFSDDVLKKLVDLRYSARAFEEALNRLNETLPKLIESIAESD